MMFVNFYVSVTLTTTMSDCQQQKIKLYINCSRITYQVQIISLTKCLYSALIFVQVKQHIYFNESLENQLYTHESTRGKFKIKPTRLRIYLLLLTNSNVHVLIVLQEIHSRFFNETFLL